MAHINERADRIVNKVFGRASGAASEDEKALKKEAASLVDKVKAARNGVNNA